MIIEIDWDTFHVKYLNQNTVFAKEFEDRYEMYTYEGIIIIKSIVMKKEDVEENIMFVDRYFSGRTNIVGFIDMYDTIPKQEPELKAETPEEEEPEDEEEEDEILGAE